MRPRERSKFAIHSVKKARLFFAERSRQDDLHFLFSTVAMLTAILSFFVRNRRTVLSLSRYLDASVFYPLIRRSRVEHNAVDNVLRVEQRDYAIVLKASSNMSALYFPFTLQPLAACTTPSHTIISASQII